MPLVMPTAQSTIGVLDDEPEMRKALQRLLACLGYHVEEYARGEDLLELVDSRRLDCLLLDLQLEGIDGFQVLETLSARQIQLPVIVITAHDEPDTAERVHRLGAVACLKKPVDRDALTSSITAALAGTDILSS